MKVEFQALFLVLFYRVVLADVDYLSRCPEYNPQNELDIELISGLWFGAEIITHYYEGRGQSQSFDSCIIIQIEEIVEDYNYDYDERSLFYSRRTDFSPLRYRFLKVQLNEGDKSAEYTLKFNGTKRGMWIGTEPPRGSVLKKHLHHSHFSGTIQVMKAVANQLVLTFCERSELFTVILTRTKNIAVDDIESIHNLLQRRGLNLQSVRELCRYISSAIRFTLPLKILLPFTTFMTMIMGILLN
ncbi:hypothetical protein PVAND_009558 [Polypedilum vanderplanki]|uniref:Uncharacterized protein n=1 Tax=Polypedilum vanderplanki TaxID=319348 RepID=A0A9J6CCX6_POLVA|nr:hypothetical protein PVAND_009558 [Polypedilum vanderplanki]